MARAKISEFRSKTLLLHDLGQDYNGVSVDTTAPIAEQLASLADDGSFVVKVDQAIKKRMKQGLVKLGRTKSDLATDIEDFAARGYRYCLIEPMFAHESSAEQYLAFEFEREATMLHYSPQGGIDIEDVADSVIRVVASDENLAAAAEALQVPRDFLSRLRQTFELAYVCSLEINPLVRNGDVPQLLDIAMVVDGEAEYLCRDYWTAEDFRNYRQQTEEEVAVAELAAKSRSSLRYEVINPDGAVWVLLSGGGASVTVADEVNNRGYGQQLGNYGEYSGNPTEPETFAYTEQVLKSLIKSTAQQKVLVIAGGVANFTDVRSTFAGIIRAIDSYAVQLQSERVKVFVRRGGPHELEGLKLIKDCLENYDLLGEVHGPELGLADSVTAALQQLGAAS